MLTAWLPLFPEFVGAFWLPVTHPFIRQNIQWIAPPHVVSAPSNETMKWGVRFIIGADVDTDTAIAFSARPVHTACFRINRPFRDPAHVRDVIRCRGSFSILNGLGRTFLGADFTGITEFRHAKING